MALGTPTLPTPSVSNNGVTVTCASFIPTGSALLLAASGCRAAVLPGAITMSTSGLTWTFLAADLYDIGSGQRNRGALYAAVAPSSPSSMTVQAASTSAARMNLTVVEITGHGGLPGNANAANHNAGDPVVVLGSAPAATSTVVAFLSVNGTVDVTPPTGFTQIDEKLLTDLILHSCYDALSPPTTVTFSSANNNPSVGLAVEVAEAAAGGAGLRLQRRGTRFQHMLVR